MTEDALLARLLPDLAGGSADGNLAVGAGDDCAAIRLHDGTLLLAAVDQVVADRHYVQCAGVPHSPERVARKLVARNLSDIAAMGGAPTFALLATAFGEGQDVEWVERFVRAVAEVCAHWDTQLIGGDLARTAGSGVASLTILGTVPETQVCCRTGARPGDHLYVTGVLGDTLASEHHLEFTPRCAEGRWLAERARPTAMIDLSDGLALDAARLARAGAVQLRIDLDQLPRRRHDLPLENLLGDGEDYELLFTIAPDAAAALAEWPFSTRLTHIGTVFPSPPHDARDSSGNLLPGTQRGWDHCRDRAEGV